MRGTILSALAAAVICAAVPMRTACASDLSAWAVSEYTQASAYGLITPSFAEKNMNENITRGEFCDLAMRAYECITGESLPMDAASPFTDTDSAYVTAAYKYGVVSGVSETEFMPDKMLTRQEMALMLERMLQAADIGLTVTEDVSELSGYSDASEIALWACQAAASMTREGFMNGIDGAFSPTTGASREQAAAIVSRICTRYGENAATYNIPQIEAADGTVTWQDVAGADGYYVIVKNTGGVAVSEAVDASVHEHNLPAGDSSVSVAAVYGETSAFSVPEDVHTAGAVNTTFVGQNLTLEEKMQRIFGGSEEYSTQEEASANMETVTINVWKLASDGTKYASTLEVEVNKALAADVVAIFDEIFADSSQFPIKNIGGYTWRSVAASGSRSQHSYGTCIDINYNENYYIRNGTVYSGSYWKPGEDPYSIEPDGIVVQTFAKYGWDWGGTAWSSSHDYMHFTYLGK